MGQNWENSKQEKKNCELLAYDYEIKRSRNKIEADMSNPT